MKHRSTSNWKLFPKKATFASLLHWYISNLKDMLSNPYCLLKIALKTIYDFSTLLVARRKKFPTILSSQLMKSLSPISLTLASSGQHSWFTSYDFLWFLPERKDHTSSHFANLKIPGRTEWPRILSWGKRSPLREGDKKTKSTHVLYSLILFE